MPILEIQFVVLKIGQLLRAMLVEARSLKRPCTLLQCLASKHVHRETVSRIECMELSQACWYQCVLVTETSSKRERLREQRKRSGEVALSIESVGTQVLPRYKMQLLVASLGGGLNRRGNNAGVAVGHKRRHKHFQMHRCVFVCCVYVRAYVHLCMHDYVRVGGFTQRRRCSRRYICMRRVAALRQFPTNKTGSECTL